jgi:hypothetical protein
VRCFAWDSCGNRWRHRESTFEKALETGVEEQMRVITGKIFLTRPSVLKALHKILGLEPKWSAEVIDFC